MRSGLDKRWLLPLGVLAASALVALGIVTLEPPLFDRSSSEEAAGCYGASANDYACYQERYQALVRSSGVEAALAELKDEYKKNDLVKAACHQLTHVIGRVAVERGGGLSDSYAQGDDFCGGGYYHGATEAVVAGIGAEKLLEEADELCAELREVRKYSYLHLNCVHGLGHGFMSVLENEIFESLYACDALRDGWEREQCYSGVFMQNVMAADDPSHHSKSLDTNRPLYPCTEVEVSYKARCYQRQTSFALQTQNNDFARIFDLCEGIEKDFRPACYEGLGRDAAQQSIERSVTDEARSASTSALCALSEEDEAQSNCVLGAVKTFVRFYHSDMQATVLCESLKAGLRAACLKAAEEYYQRPQS